MFWYKKNSCGQRGPFLYQSQMQFGLSFCGQYWLGKREREEGLTFDVTNEIQEKESKKRKTFFCQRLTDKVKNFDCTILFVLRHKKCNRKKLNTQTFRQIIG